MDMDKNNICLKLVFLDLFCEANLKNFGKGIRFNLKSRLIKIKMPV